MQTLLRPDSFALCGYISTVKKQGKNILEEPFNALDGKPFLPQLAGGAEWLPIFYIRCLCHLMRPRGSGN
jgi:hypothetical protein